MKNVYSVSNIKTTWQFILSYTTQWNVYTKHPGHSGLCSVWQCFLDYNGYFHGEKYISRAKQKNVVTIYEIRMQVNVWQLYFKQPILVIEIAFLLRLGGYRYQGVLLRAVSVLIRYVILRVRAYLSPK